MTAVLLPLGIMAATAVPAFAAPVAQGFTVTPADLAFILRQIKIGERHVASNPTAADPCKGILGDAPDQVPNPLLSFGIRTVDGSCNNLQPARDRFGASDQEFPRIGTPKFNPAEPPGVFGPPGAPATSYAQKKGNVVDSTPRTVSNLIVDQTSTNPAAVAAAGFPVRSQGNPGVFPCTTDPDDTVDPPVVGVPTGCTPSHQTLFIPNVTTDVGLSPPFNSLFTLFGQFFDHGLDFVSKSGGTVFVPLNSDDPLIAGPDHVVNTGDDLTPNLRFMVLTRATNGPGPDGIVGDRPDTPAIDESADDVQDGTNRDSPLVDQSQTYTSHSSHQVFLREYKTNNAGRPVTTGRLLSQPDGGMSTWKNVKDQAGTLLGLKLGDVDVLNIPMIAADPYGKFIPGPARGLPQYVTNSGLVEGDTAGGGVAVPADVKRIDTAFLDDIAHHAAPGTFDTDGNPQTPGRSPQTPDTDPGTADDNDPKTYDDEMLNTHFCAGDGRTNENIGLTAIHQVFHSEHDRLAEEFRTTLTNDTSAGGVAALAEWKLAAGADGWNGERLFQAARFVTEMEYQHLVFEEFARKVQPLLEPFRVYHDNVNPAIKAEFAHAVYRFGHSMLTETISRFTEDAAGKHTNFDIPLLDGFLNPPSYQNTSVGQLDSKAAGGAVFMGMSDQTGNEIDEFVTDTLRNNLLGLPLDLPTLNIARARDTGTPTLNNLRKQVFAANNDGQMQPYGSWVQFGLGLKHPQSLVNFVAAYGKHPTVVNATTLAAKRLAAQRIVDPPSGTDPAFIPTDAAQFMNSTVRADDPDTTTVDESTPDWSNVAGNSATGVDDIDLWMGGLAEKTNLFGGLLGSTFNYVFETQLLDLQNGDRFYYLARTPGMNLRAQLEGNSFAEMIMRNTSAHSLKADAFATADCKFELKGLNGTPAGFNSFGNTVADDPNSECEEQKLLIRQPDGTIQYRTTNSVDPSGINGQAVYNGKDDPAVPDRVFGGADNDTFLGNAGNDRIEGGDGADVALGGEGNDIITDLAGDDVPKGGPGNDAIDAGPGLDIVMGGDGKDFTNGGANTNETFGGEGDDFIIAGQGIDTVFGDSGDDWIQGGDGQDLLCGDSCAPFFDDPNKPGNDILIGQNGEEDYDAEGGDDIMHADAGIERNAGAGGWDWSSYQYDTLPADADLNLGLIGVPLPATVFRDRYQEVEALSGGRLDDKLRGDDVVPTAVGGAGFTGCDVLDQAGLDRIPGLDPLVPPLTVPAADIQALASANSAVRCPLTGNVWGDGNIILGGPGSDLIEGRGANDIIDGDKNLRVRLSVRTNAADPGSEIGTTDLMEHPYLPGNPKTLQQAVFAGEIDPGNIVAVREIVSTPGANDVDTAQFSGARAEYDISTDQGTLIVNHARPAATANDGIDRLTGIEKLLFTDQTVILLTPAAPTGVTATAGNASATVNWTAPAPNGGPAITSYEIVATTGTTVTTVATGIPATATNRVVTGLTNGAGYTFQVRAVNQSGPGALSAPSNAVTPTGTPAPTITAQVPAPGATNVALDSNVSATFSVPMVAAGFRGSGNAAPTVVLRTTVGNAVVGSALTYNATTRTVMLNPNANLAHGTQYTMTLTGGATDIRSVTGNVPLVTTSWTFTTVNPPPTLTARSPANGAVLVGRGVNVTATMSERVVGVSLGAVSTNVVLTQVSNGARIAAVVTLSANGQVITLNPNATLGLLTQYRVTLTGGPGDIRDAQNAPFTSTSWTFTTL
jgi:Ca2+-binding RTX toxin-like protein